MTRKLLSHVYITKSSLRDFTAGQGSKRDLWCNRAWIQYTPTEKFEPFLHSEQPDSVRKLLVAPKVLLNAYIRFIMS